MEHWSPPPGVKQYKDTFDVENLPKPKSKPKKRIAFDDQEVISLFGKLIRKLDDRSHYVGGDGNACKKQLSDSYTAFLTWAGVKK